MDKSIIKMLILWSMSVFLIFTPYGRFGLSLFILVLSMIAVNVIIEIVDWRLEKRGEVKKNDMSIVQTAS